MTKDRAQYEADSRNRNGVEPEYSRPFTVHRYIHYSLIACSQAERDGLQAFLDEMTQRGLSSGGIIPGLLSRMKVVP